MVDFQVNHENFEGPLDLLLELIEKEKLSISQISLARVTDDYIKYVKSGSMVDPEKLADFLVVAAQLMLIKSRSLLPSLELSEEERGSIEDLEKRLEEYKKIKELVRELKKIENQHKFIFTREAYLEVEPVFYPPQKTMAETLHIFFIAFIESLPKIEKLAEDRIKKIISIEEKIKQIQLFLQGAVERAFSDVVRGTREKVEVIVSFLAILELAKQKFIDLEQDAPFADIMIKKSHENQS